MPGGDFGDEVGEDMIGAGKGVVKLVAGAISNSFLKQKDKSIEKTAYCIHTLRDAEEAAKAVDALEKAGVEVGLDKKTNRIVFAKSDFNRALSGLERSGLDQVVERLKLGNYSVVVARSMERAVSLARRSDDRYMCVYECSTHEMAQAIADILEKFGIDFGHKPDSATLLFSSEDIDRIVDAVAGYFDDFVRDIKDGRYDHLSEEATDNDRAAVGNIGRYDFDFPDSAKGAFDLLQKSGIEADHEAGTVTVLFNAADRDRICEVAEKEYPDFVRDISDGKFASFKANDLTEARDKARDFDKRSSERVYYHSFTTYGAYPENARGVVDTLKKEGIDYVYIPSTCVLYFNERDRESMCRAAEKEYPNFVRDINNHRITRDEAKSLDEVRAKVDESKVVYETSEKVISKDRETGPVAIDRNWAPPTGQPQQVPMQREASVSVSEKAPAKTKKKLGPLDKRLIKAEKASKKQAGKEPLKDRSKKIDKGLRKSGPR
jgi:hypothetical protein